MVFPYLSVYIVLLGATGTQLGAINSVGMLVSAVFGLVVGNATKRIGIKRVYLVGVALVALSYFATGLANNWHTVFLGGVIWWCGSTATGHCCGTVCGNSLLNADRATAMGCCETFVQGLMGLIGPMFGAMLVTRFGGVSARGIRPIFFVVFMLSLGSLFLVSTQLSEVAGDFGKNQGGLAYHNPLLLLRERPDLWRFVGVSCITNLPTSMVLPFTQVFASEIKMADQYVLGAMVTASALMSLVFGIPLGRLSDRIGRKRVLYALAPFFWASNLLVVRSSCPGSLILAGLLQGAFPITLVIHSAMAFELVPSDKMSDWMAVLRVFRMLSGAFLVFMSGLIWDRIGPQYVLLLGVGIDAAIRIPLLVGVPETLDTTV